MAATFHYAKQYSWSNIKRAKQPAFLPIATHDEDERGSSEGLLEKGSADSSRATPRPLWKDPAFLIFQGVLLSFYLLVLSLVAASKVPSCSDAHGPYCTQLPYVVSSRKNVLSNIFYSASGKHHRMERHKIHTRGPHSRFEHLLRCPVAGARQGLA